MGMSSAEPASIGKKSTTQNRLEATARKWQASAEDTRQRLPSSFIMKRDFPSVLLTTGAVSTRSGNLTMPDMLAANPIAVQYIKALTRSGCNRYGDGTFKLKAK